MNFLIKFFITFIIMDSAQAQYDSLKRFTLLEDKFKTEEMLRPYGHDFLKDIVVRTNKDLKNFIGDIRDLSNLEGMTQTQKLERAREILHQYDKTEQTIHARIHLGIPIFSFKIFGVSFSPNLRVGIDWGINLGIRSYVLTGERILELLGSEVSPALRNYWAQIDTSTLTPGDDMALVFCRTQSIPDNLCPNRGRYFWPEDQDTPMMAVFTKVDAKAGFFIPYETKHWFGDFNLYPLFRSDFKLLMSAEQIARDQNPIEGSGGDRLKEQLFLMADYRLGYRNSNYSLFFSAEELKISRLSDNIDKAGDIAYKTSPLYRFHATAMYRWGIFLLRPFVGLHKREGYNLNDGHYGGLDLGTYIFGDRLYMLFRGMADKEHFTFSSRFKLVFLELEYSIKTPIKDERDDVKISTMHSINLRFRI